MANAAIKVPQHQRQVAFHQLLAAARKSWLMDALRETLADVDPEVMKAQLAIYIPVDVQRSLSAAGVRDEYVFPTPAILEKKPTLVGYYRLLLGSPQKTFYGSRTGMGQFKSMESRGLLSSSQKTNLGQFCDAMAQAISELIRGVPTFSHRDLEELPLLTLGSQFQGGNNNKIGRQAAVDIFMAVSEIVKPYTTNETASTITLKNAAGRKVVLVLSGDPDIRIQEEFHDELRNKVAIEIKGGMDASNAHNRAGEAEKSHQKARRSDFRDYWTVIAKGNLRMDTLRDESPTTHDWFDLAQVLARDGDDWNLFSSRLADAVGIPIASHKAIR
jgi:hypothetical protein